jgi:adenine specific DNA methylase Mod
MVRAIGNRRRSTFNQRMTNHLHYGDNLQVLRENIAAESVNLVYLDPPFNSQASYNILFRAPSGEQSKAQIEAFEDTWHWNDHAERAFDEVTHSGNTDAAEMLRAMRAFLKENDMMAYLTMPPSRDPDPLPVYWPAICRNPTSLVIRPPAIETLGSQPVSR